MITSYRFHNTRETVEADYPSNQSGHSTSYFLTGLGLIVVDEATDLSRFVRSVVPKPARIS